MWRRSWLSREVLLFTLFAGAATAYSAALWLGLSGAGWLGALTACLGICGVGASARLYLVPGRPAWNSPLTIAEFASTTALLGACGANILARSAADARYAVAWGTALVFATAGIKLMRLGRSRTHELHGSWQLLNTAFSNHLLIRFALPCAGLALLPFGAAAWVRIALALFIVSGEFIGRYLFFVSVVPMNMAREYLAQEAA
jgi:formate dehydrogenase iron-sulfur subunit